MKLSLTVILVATWLPTPSAYQNNPDTKWVSKKAIQKSIQTTKPKPSPTALESMAASVTSPLTFSELFPDDPPNYWFNSKIHTFGNTGLFGGLHAAMAPLATKLIDIAAYDGKNVREQVCESLVQVVGKPNARIADLCCGVGISTRALQGAFCQADSIVAVDTSPEMIAMAKMISSMSILDKLASFLKAKAPTMTTDTETERFPTYGIANAENTGLPHGSFDLVTIMYAFHEAPYEGRSRMLKEAKRLLAPGATLAVVDISPNYTPSDTMLAGEPYVLEYQKNIERQLRGVDGFENLQYKEVVPGHVSVWLLSKRGRKTAQVARSQPTGILAGVSK